MLRLWLFVFIESGRGLEDRHPYPFTELGEQQPEDRHGLQRDDLLLFQVDVQLCRLPSSSRGELPVKQPTGNHGEVHSRQEFDAKSSYLVEAKMKKVAE